MASAEYWDKLTGVSFENRQDTIAKMTGEETLTITPRPDNKYDVYACEVLADGEPIGWIPKGRNQEISATLQSGQAVTIDDYNITGGENGKNYGVNIHIVLPVTKQLKNMKELKPAIGEGLVYFDEANHRYFDEDGNPMISGSQFEDEQAGKLDLTYAAEAIAKSTGLAKEQVQQLWEKNGELSRDFGTLVHSALEHYISSKDVLEEYDRVKERPHTALNWMSNALGEIVDKYALEFDIDNTECEIFIRHGNHCGFVDQLKYIDKDTVILRDYKIIEKLKDVKTKDYGKIPKYTCQQSFYCDILEKNGIKVDKLVLHLYDGNKWSEKELKRVKL